MRFCVCVCVWGLKSVTLKAHSPFSHLKAPVALISDNDDTYVNTSAALFNVSLFHSLSLPFYVTHPQAHNLPPSSLAGCRAEWRCLPLMLRSTLQSSQSTLKAAPLCSPAKTNTWSNLTLNLVKRRRKPGSGTLQLLINLINWTKWSNKLPNKQSHRLGPVNTHSCSSWESIKYGNSPDNVFAVISPVTHGQMKPDISKSVVGKREPNRPPGRVSHHDMTD